MTRVLHTARISDVGSVMFVNRIRKIVSSELGKEKREICSSFCHERGTKSCFFFYIFFLRYGAILDGSYPTHVLFLLLTPAVFFQSI